MKKLICCRWCNGEPGSDSLGEIRLRRCTNPGMTGVDHNCAYCPENNRPETLETWERRFGPGLLDPRKCCPVAKPSGINVFPQRK